MRQSIDPEIFLWLYRFVLSVSSSDLNLPIDSANPLDDPDGGLKNEKCGLWLSLIRLQSSGIETINRGTLARGQPHASQ